MEWLWSWLLNTPIFEFEWDKGNSLKNFVKHKVTRQEVEEVFIGRQAIPLGKQMELEASEDRYGIINHIYEWEWEEGQIRITHKSSTQERSYCGNKDLESNR